MIRKGYKNRLIIVITLLCVPLLIRYQMISNDHLPVVSVIFLKSTKFYKTIVDLIRVWKTRGWEGNN